MFPIIFIALIFCSAALMLYVHISYVQRLKKTIKTKHPDIWKELIEDTTWLTPSWSSLYGTKRFYEFACKSIDDLGDKEVKLLKTSIRAFAWQFLTWIVLVTLITIATIYIGYLK